MSQMGQKIECDGCGRDCGNGGIYSAVHVGDLNMDTGTVLNLHFCRDHLGADDKKVKGCGTKLLSGKVLEHFLKNNEPYTPPTDIPVVEEEPEPVVTSAEVQSP